MSTTRHLLFAVVALVVVAFALVTAGCGAGSTTTTRAVGRAGQAASRGSSEREEAIPSPAIAGGAVYFGGGDGYLYALK